MDFYTNRHPDLNKAQPKYGISDLKRCGPISRNDPAAKPTGIKLEQDRTTKNVYVKEVTEGGMFQRLTSIKVGDRVVKINGQFTDEFMSLFDMNKLLNKEKELTIHILTDAAKLKHEG